MRLKKAYFIGVILGKIYGAFEYIDGLLRHYWLQEPADWKAGTVYPLGALVQPTTHNGYYYQAPTSSPIPAWEASKVYVAGAKVQPTVANGYYYELVDVTGTGATSGTVEPVWPTEDGAEVFEGEDSTTVPSVSTASTTSTTDLISPEITDRYGLDGT